MTGSGDGNGGGKILAEFDRRLVLLLVLIFGSASGGGAVLGRVVTSDAEQVRRIIREEMAALSVGQHREVRSIVTERVAPLERDVQRLNEAVFEPRRYGTEKGRVLGLEMPELKLPGTGG